MTNYRNQNNYSRLNKSTLNVKPRRRTLKFNKNNNMNMPPKTYRGNEEFKVAFPPTRIRDWMYETQPALSPENPELGWMGSNNIVPSARNSKGTNSVAHDLEALPIDPLAPVPVPLKDLQPMNNNNVNSGRAIKSNTIFAHNLRGLAPKRQKTPVSSRVPWYAQSTAASRARVKATDAPGRQKAIEEHYRKIGLTRRRKNRRSK